MYCSLFLQRCLFAKNPNPKNTTPSGAFLFCSCLLFLFSSKFYHICSSTNSSLSKLSLRGEEEFGQIKHLYSTKTTICILHGKKNTGELENTNALQPFTVRVFIYIKCCFKLLKNRVKQKLGIKKVLCRTSFIFNEWMQRYSPM